MCVNINPYIPVYVSILFPFPLPSRLRIILYSFQLLNHFSPPLKKKELFNIYFSAANLRLFFCDEQINIKGSRRFIFNSFRIFQRVLIICVRILSSSRSRRIPLQSRIFFILNSFSYFQINYFVCYFICVFIIFSRAGYYWSVRRGSVSAFDDAQQIRYKSTVAS